MESLDGLYVFFTPHQEFDNIVVIFSYNTISHLFPFSFCLMRMI